MWRSFENGHTIGSVGSENGLILRDDEHSLGARITLERDTRVAPFAITCGVYGWMFHTRFFSDSSEAEAQFSLMKAALAQILQVIPLVSDPAKAPKMRAVRDALDAFVQRYP